MCGSISIENISFSKNCDNKITNAKSVTDATIWEMFISKNSDTLEIAEHSLFKGPNRQNAISVRVYSDRTRQRQNDGVKHNSLEMEYMFVNRSIQTGRVDSKNLDNRDAVVLTLARPV